MVVAVVALAQGHIRKVGDRHKRHLIGLPASWMAHELRLRPLGWVRSQWSKWVFNNNLMGMHYQYQLPVSLLWQWQGTVVTTKGYKVYLGMRCCCLMLLLPATTITLTLYKHKDWLNFRLVLLWLLQRRQLLSPNSNLHSESKIRWRWCLRVSFVTLIV
jgi:hypothetical protein